MRQITNEELGEPDVILNVLPDRIQWVLDHKPIADLLTGYIPRERADGSWEYRLPAYLAREVEAAGARLVAGRASAQLKSPEG